MKILHIQGEYYPFGGAETYLRDLCNDQLQKKHEVQVVYTSDFPQEYLPKPFEYHFSSSWGIRTGIKLKEKILPFIEKYDPDVIHMHVVHFAISPIVLKAICKRWPVVYTVHDILWLCIKSCIASSLRDSARILPNGDICNRRFGLACILKGCLSSALRNSPHQTFNRFLISLWKLHALKQASMFIVNSEYAKERLIDHSFAEESIRIVRPYLSVSEAWGNIHPYHLSGSDRNIILYVGKFSKHKGIYDLIDAVALIKSRNFRLLFVGDGEERDQLDSYARCLGVSDNVVIKGPVDRKELCSYYGNAALVVLPSRCPETFGLVGLEAMYFKKPVVAYDVGAIREWLDHGYVGYLVKHGDINGLSKRIEDILRDPRLQKGMGRRGKFTAASYIDKERFMNEILNTYENTIKAFALNYQHKRATRVQTAEGIKA